MLLGRASFVVAVVIAALLAPLTASGQAGSKSDPTLWRFVYPNAKALISIDWARIRPSPAGALIRDKWLNTGARSSIPGMELLNDIDRVLISSPGKNSSDDSDESPILIAIHGHFDATQVRQLFASYGAKPQSYNSFQVYRPQNKGPQGDAKDTAWVLFDGETILCGDAPSIFSALDRSRFESPPIESGSLLARASEMDANYEAWLIMDAAEIVSTDQIAALFQGGEWASEAQGFEAGVNLQAGLAADITVHFSSDATARRMTAELTRVMNIAAKDKTSGAELNDLARKLKFNLAGSATKISLHLTEQELQKTTEAMVASHKAGAKMAANPTPLPNTVPASAKPAPAKPAVIRIEGLDDGPLEIPYQPEKDQ